MYLTSICQEKNVEVVDVGCKENEFLIGMRLRGQTY